MDVDAFLAGLKASDAYADQIVHVHVDPARSADHAAADTVDADVEALARRLGVTALYRHQAEALRAVGADRNVLVATGTASGKSLCYVLPVLHALQRDASARALLLFPTKALCQDQFTRFQAQQKAAGLAGRLAGVFDGDTPSDLRRRLRDRGACLFSNPDMVHAALLPQHGRWAEFLAGLRYLVLDELHVYSGIFGTNMLMLLRRLLRVCAHYGSRPRIIASSATIANPGALAETLTEQPFQTIETDGSPRGRRVYVLWNPPRERGGHWKSRRSANVEAHELMARLVEQGVPTIAFSKAKITAEMIHRYVCDRLRERAPRLVGRVTPYRGGYLPTERREIERRLFSGELLGVSATPALELGIDVGALEACIIVGYPGTLASFFQQAGRAGRKSGDSVVFLVGLDTSVNQYIMTRPDYLFARCIEDAVIDPHNPFVATGHLRCATHELPLPAVEVPRFGPHAETVLQVLDTNRKVKQVAGTWYHAAHEVPQHEVSLRDVSQGFVVIQEVGTQRVIGQLDRFDAPAIVHPHAIYLHRGETYRVLELDLERNIATVESVDVDYYTQPYGGTDVHHIDARLREKPLGTATVCWGEVTAYFDTRAYRKIHFYSLDTVSVHGLDLPTMQMETMAVWLIPPEALMVRVREADLDPHSGLRGIGYATRMLLPLFMTCDTLDFSHTVGSANSPWHTTFVYERYPLGLGFTEKAYGRAHELFHAVRDSIRACPCEEGCPCCVGKPLRQFAGWNVELGEASIPSKAAALMILDGVLVAGSEMPQPDRQALSPDAAGEAVRLEQALRRRLERMREPLVFHPIRPERELETGTPPPEAEQALDESDASLRRQRKGLLERDMHRRLAKKLDAGGLAPSTGRKRPPKALQARGGNLTPTAFPGRPLESSSSPPVQEDAPGGANRIVLGDDLAARARKRYKQKRRPPTDPMAQAEESN